MVSNPLIELLRVTASYKEMQRWETAVCNPTTLNLHAQTIYHENYPLRWIQGHDLIQDQPTWLPLATIDFAHTNNRDMLPFLFDVSSNGLASGNHLIKAISHGICEVMPFVCHKFMICIIPENQALI